LDIEAEKSLAKEPVEEVSDKPKPKLKKKEQLESSLLEAIEEHGADSL
jgi:hypothetical protein